MANIYARTGDCNFTSFDQLKPRKIVPYADLIRGWLAEPLRVRELEDLEQCLADTGGRLDRKRLLNERPWFNPALRQRLPLLQPSVEALTLLHKMRGNAFYLTRGEAALDWMFPRDEVERAGTLIRRHVRWLHHRKPITIYRNTMYLNPPSSAKNLALYHDLPSRKTNKPCAHACYRMCGHPILLAHGLATLEDWLRIDYYDFFAAVLLFSDLDLERLGHLLRNKESRRKGRSGGHGRSRHNSDYDEGLRHFEQHSKIRGTEFLSVQQYLDQFRNYVDVRSCTVELDNSCLLPNRPKPSHTSYGVCVIPHSSFHLRPSHRDNFNFSASKTTFSRTSTISKPVLGPRPSKLLPRPPLRSWKSTALVSSSYPTDFVVPRFRWKSMNPSLPVPRGSHGGEQCANAYRRK